MQGDTIRKHACKTEQSSSIKVNREQLMGVEGGMLGGGAITTFANGKSINALLQAYLAILNGSNSRPEGNVGRNKHT